MQAPQVRAFLELSPGQVLSADGAGVFIRESQEGNAKVLSRGAQHPGLGDEGLACGWILLIWN